MAKDLTLLVMAAGMGSRYGGLKQIDPMGVNGEVMLDYSVYDAIRAGFTKVVFVINKKFAQEFSQKIISRFVGKIPVDVVFQEINDLPAPYTAPVERLKPWGTLHAVLAARNVIHENFAVINADDFYGDNSYQKISEFYQNINNLDNDLQCCMVGYPIKKTLPEKGEVNRGICVEKNGLIERVDEFKVTINNQNGVISGTIDGDSWQIISENTLASMNCWGFPANIFSKLGEVFKAQLQENINSAKSEYYLPTAITQLINKNQITCKLLTTTGQWFGVTYQEDKSECVKKIAELINLGKYPAKLWV